MRGYARDSGFIPWRRQRDVLREVASYGTGGAGLNLTGGDHPMQIEGVHVTRDSFTLFGAPVIAGRTFTAEEDSPHGGNVVVLSYGLWKQRFGGDTHIVGRTIQLDNTPYLVVGVIGRSFNTENPADLWIPYQFDLNTQDIAHYFEAEAASDDSHNKIGSVIQLNADRKGSR